MASSPVRAVSFRPEVQAALVRLPCRFQLALAVQRDGEPQGRVGIIGQLGQHLLVQAWARTASFWPSAVQALCRRRCVSERTSLAS